LQVTGPDRVETAPTGSLTLQLLEWIAARPRSYAETMEAWRTSCPRLPVWEDAIDGGLVAVVRNAAGMKGSVVRLTRRGRDMLARHGP
jgi:hypothetical protein